MDSEISKGNQDSEQIIRYNFSNHKLFAGATPHKCVIRNINFKQEKWRNIYRSIVSFEIEHKNSNLSELYNRPLTNNKQDESIPFFVKEKPLVKGELNYRYELMPNRFYVNLNYSIPDTIYRIGLFCKLCGYSEEEIIIEGIKNQQNTMLKRDEDNHDNYMEDKGDNDDIISKQFESSEPRNLIYFGAPGTGKSFLLNHRMHELIGKNNEADYERVTFHPDYT